MALNRTITASMTPAQNPIAQCHFKRGHTTVLLPSIWAKAALQRYLDTASPHAQVLDTLPLSLHSPSKEALSDLTHWAIKLPQSLQRPLGLVFAATSVHEGPWVIGCWPKHEVWLLPRSVPRLLQALEAVKPLDPEGMPLPWFEGFAPLPTPNPELEFEFNEGEDHTDLASASSPDPLYRDFEVHFSALCRLAGFDLAPYHMKPAPSERGGLCTGKVYFQLQGPLAFTPLRILFSPCPNGDLAELLATAIHELAHPLARSRRHDSHFHVAMVELASSYFGATAMAPLRAYIGASTARLDMWLATCIRAALRHEAPPQPADTRDELAMARALSRHRKLRALACDQPGKPEGIAAQAAANDLVTRFELPHYEFNSELTLSDDTLCDRWIALTDASLWRRILAFAVAAHYGVFALALSKPRCMHYFGALADVTAAHYLFTTTLARIEREVVLHMHSFKAHAPKTRAEVLSERVSFCTSAVIAFREKLQLLAKEDPQLQKRLGRAETFAAQAHEARGLSWGTGRKRSYRENASGRAFGASLEPTEGLKGTNSQTHALTLKGNT